MPAGAFLGAENPRRRERKMSIQPRVLSSPDHPQTARDADPQVAIDRRRAGRIKDVSPALIPLLRNPSATGPLAPENEDSEMLLSP